MFHYLAQSDSPTNLPARGLVTRDLQLTVANLVAMAPEAGSVIRPMARVILPASTMTPVDYSHVPEGEAVSGLAAVLAGRTRAGVYRWSSPADPAEVRHAVEHAGWQFAHLDTWAAEDKSGFMDAVTKAFDLPEGFGRNWDALADSLSEVRHDQGTVVLWDGWSPFARAHRSSFDVALDVLRQRTDTRRGGACVVLMRGDGPPIDVPDVDPHAPRNPLAPRSQK
jgi:RNAse (barnase) inhibitor barstar